MAFGLLNVIRGPKRTNPNVGSEMMIVYWLRRVCFAVVTRSDTRVEPKLIPQWTKVVEKFATRRANHYIATYKIHATDAYKAGHCT